MRYPFFLDLTGRSCLVVGGGAVALRKVKVLLKAQANVRVVSPSFVGAFKPLSKRNKVDLRTRTFRKTDVRGMVLVVAATDEIAVNARVADAADAVNAWVNVVDAPDRTTFAMGAVAETGALTVAISTGGASPALARWLKKDVMQRYKVFGKQLPAIEAARKQLKQSMQETRQRQNRHQQALNAYLRVLNK